MYWQLHKFFEHVASLKYFGTKVINQTRLFNNQQTKEYVMFCWPYISIYSCNETNLMNYLSSFYSVTIPLHVSGLLLGYHQEATMYICNNWYVLYVSVDCRRASWWWASSSPKHVEAQGLNKIKINSASSCFIARTNETVSQWIPLILQTCLHASNAIGIYQDTLHVLLYTYIANVGKVYTPENAAFQGKKITFTRQWRAF
jgi:hypothetical protein